MNSPIRLCLCLHNHQPVGNFDHVFEQAYNDSYRPFLDVFEQFQLPISLHTSGPLIEWLDEHHPEYIDRLAKLAAESRIEIIGGAFYEPILTMIPSRDRVGQIVSYSKWLRDRIGVDVAGMWIPERVWEPSLTSDLVRAGIRYTLLDDFHFKCAGLSDDELCGYYVAEEEGQVLSIFPGSERLRYTIPFEDPQATIDHLRHVANQRPGAVVVFGDDGEKFGTWPETKQHVYDNGWLHRFFSALEANADWIHLATLGEAHSDLDPAGKIYLPEASYREMTEWALPVEKQIEYENAAHAMEGDARWQSLRSLVRGGFWRNFKVKYPESNEMYSRMMAVSDRVEQARHEDVAPDLLQAAQQDLYRGQCNCCYWHGAFGGIYLPHLRNAIYQHLIAADNRLEKINPVGVTGTAKDYNFDARQEVRLSNEHLVCWIAPATGGQIYELDVRSICHNLLATLSRHPEAYHRKVLAGPTTQGGDVASIHDRVIFKQEGLDQRLQYDAYPRKSLVDHFYDAEVSLEAVAKGEAEERGDFLTGAYEARIRRNPGRTQVQLLRNGHVDGSPLCITKGVTLEEGSSHLEIAYLLEGIPQDRELHFSIEMNFSGLPGGAEDRFFQDGQGARLGQLDSLLERSGATDLSLVDQWLGIDVNLAINQPTHWWAYPIETVSQSESGFELIHQSVAVQPHWFVRGDSQGRWSMTMRLSIDTARAKERETNHPLREHCVIGGTTIRQETP